MKRILGLITLLSLLGCSSASVNYAKYSDKDFKKEKYLGKWYEIARKDHWFEKNLSNVTAEYSVKPNGEIEVKNSGYNEKDKKADVAIGSAKQSNKMENMLEVTFFWPFYADYIIMEYDKENYGYALVRSKSPEYLWILAREPVISDEILKKLLKTAENDGLRTDDLIYVKHQMKALGEK